jgi:hypothetical protein
VLALWRSGKSPPRAQEHAAIGLAFEEIDPHAAVVLLNDALREQLDRFS